MTLAEIIARYEGAQTVRAVDDPIPFWPAVLSPRAHAAAGVVRLGAELAELSPADRVHVCALLRDLIADLDVTD
jgi:hypothetical protein